MGWKTKQMQMNNSIQLTNQNQWLQIYKSLSLTCLQERPEYLPMITADPFSGTRQTLYMWTQWAKTPESHRKKLIMHAWKQTVNIASTDSQQTPPPPPPKKKKREREIDKQTNMVPTVLRCWLHSIQTEMSTFNWLEIKLLAFTDKHVIRIICTIYTEATWTQVKSGDLC